MKLKFFFKEYNWNLDLLVEALKLTEDEVRRYGRDGRRTSFLMEIIICKEMKGTMAPNENYPFDFEDNQQKKLEVRCLTIRGVNFRPSKNTGSGRAYDKKTFEDKLKLLEGYFVADIRNFPKVATFKIFSNKIEEWYKNNKLKKDASLSAKKFYQYIDIE